MDPQSNSVFGSNLTFTLPTSVLGCQVFAPWTNYLLREAQYSAVLCCKYKCVAYDVCGTVWLSGVGQIMCAMFRHRAASLPSKDYLFS